MNKHIKHVESPTIELSKASIEEIAKSVGAIYSHNIWWKKLRIGFWCPLDFTSSFEIMSRPPKFKYWGFQHLTNPEKANSQIKYMFIENLQDYHLQIVGPKARNKIRQSLRNLEIRKIQNSDEKETEQARNCWNDLVERTGWRQKMNSNTFYYYWNDLLCLPGHTILGAYHEGKLIGWLVGIYFDNGNCYITRYASLTEFINLRANNGLVYMFLISAKNSGAKNVNFGLFIPERLGLDNFKENMGFKTTSFPAFTYINPILKSFILKFFKAEIERLTGWRSKKLKGMIAI